jgi:hypothetical protein
MLNFSLLCRLFQLVNHCIDDADADIIASDGICVVVSVIACAAVVGGLST